MVDLYQLNLPAPSPLLISSLQNIVDSIDLDKENKKWLDQQNNINNSAEHIFFKPFNS
jgi:hypothetical protein